MEDKFEQLFELEEENLNESITVTINKRIMKIIGKYVLVLLCILIVILSIIGINYTYTKSIYYNPLKEEKVAEMYEKDVFELKEEGAFKKLSKDEQEYVQLQYYDYLVATYFSVFAPGTYYGGTVYNVGDFIKYQHPGCYYLTGKFGDGFRTGSIKYGNTVKEVYENEEYVIGQSRNGAILFENRFVFAAQKEDIAMMDEVACWPLGEDWMDKKIEEMKQEVASMPDSSKFMAFVSLKDKIPLQNWGKGKVADYDYRYVLTGFTSKGDCIGFTIDDYTGFPYSATAQEVYGNYWSEFETSSSEDYYAHFKTHLTILKEHPEFTSTFNIGEMDKLEGIETMLEKVENKEVYVKGYLVHATKQEMLEMIEDSNTSYVHIEDVKYSRYEKNR